MVALMIKQSNKIVLSMWPNSYLLPEKRYQDPTSNILKQLRSENDEMSLMAICRKSIRKYFLDVDLASEPFRQSTKPRAACYPH